MHCYLLYTLKKMLQKNIYSNKYIILQIVLYLFTVFYSLFNLKKNCSFSVNLLFTLVGLFSLWCLFSDKNKMFSLNKVFWLFNYTFFFLAPLFQFKRNIVFYIVNFKIDNSLYLKVIVVSLTAFIIYFFAYMFFFKKFKKTFTLNRNYVSNGFLYIIISLFSCFFFLYLIKFNFDVLFYRPKAGWLKLNVLYGNVGYGFVSIIRYVPFLCFLHYFFTTEKKDKIAIVLLLITLFICFPTSMSRGILAAIYLPIFMIFIPNLKKGNNFVLLYLFAIAGVFPFLNSFRNFKDSLRLNYELFTSGQFDAFQNFMLLLDKGIVTNGEQLLNNFQFFRSLTGSGQVLAEQLGHNFFNIAMPYIGEGYINFGYFGIIIFIVLLAFFNAWFDAKLTNLTPFLKAIYYVLIGFEFYILRGDLGSSIKKMSGFILALLIIEACIFLNKKIVNKTSF